MYAEAYPDSDIATFHRQLVQYEKQRKEEGNLSNPSGIGKKDAGQGTGSGFMDWINEKLGFKKGKK